MKEKQEERIWRDGDEGEEVRGVEKGGNAIWK